MKTLELQLKPEFREPLSQQIGFVGREHELARIAALLRWRSAATLLVSGHRGVGKTALVNEAVARSKAEGNSKLVARLSLPHVYSHVQESDPRELRLQILRSLARALYFSLKDEDDIDDGIVHGAAELYAKTYLKDLTVNSGIESLAEAEVRTEVVSKTETTWNPGRTTQMIIGSSLGGAIAVGGVAVAAHVGKLYGNWWGAGTLFVILIAALASGLSISRSKSDTKTVGEKLSAKGQFSRTGIYDLSPETLEFELEDLLGQLSEAKRPCVSSLMSWTSSNPSMMTRQHLNSTSYSRLWLV